jgi:hypothetical protein
MKRLLERFLRRSSSPRPRRSPARRTRLVVEALEERAVPATFWVTNTLDDGSVGSLRWAITWSNHIAGPNVIDFDIAPGGAQSIALQSGLPFITNQVTIDGSTQPGFAGKPLIELNGAAAGQRACGLVFGWSPGTDVENCIVRSLVINRFDGDGILFNNSRYDSVQGCYIGTDLSGTIALGNLIGIRDEADISIGAPFAGGGNVISGNRDDGVFILGTGDTVQNNFIGTDASGTRALGNGGNGIHI